MLRDTSEGPSLDEPSTILFRNSSSYSEERGREGGREKEGERGREGRREGERGKKKREGGREKEGEKKREGGRERERGRKKRERGREGGREKEEGEMKKGGRKKERERRGSEAGREKESSLLHRHTHTMYNICIIYIHVYQCELIHIIIKQLFSVPTIRCTYKYDL